MAANKLARRLYFQVIKGQSAAGNSGAFLGPGEFLDQERMDIGIGIAVIVERDDGFGCIKYFESVNR